MSKQKTDRLTDGNVYAHMDSMKQVF